MTRAPLLAAVVVTVALSTSGAAVATPQPVSPRGMRVQQVELAASPVRHGLVMAGYRGTLRDARWALLVKLGDRPLQRLDGSVFAPRIAIGADGTAIAAWGKGRSLRVAIARPGHGFGRPRTLATAPGDSTTGLWPGGIAVGAHGDGVTAWRHGDGPAAEIRVAFRRGAGFAAAQTLGQSYYAPALALTPDNAFVAAWQTPPRLGAPGITGNPTVVLATAANGARTFGAPTQLAGPPTFLVSPPSAFSGPGGAAVTWDELPDRQVTVVGRRQSFARVNLGARRSDDLAHDDSLSVAVRVDRSVVAVWRFVRASSPELHVVGSQVMATVRQPNSAVAAPQALSPASRLAGTPVVAAVGERAMAAWSEREPEAGARLRLRVHDERGWNAPVTVATADAIADVRLASAGRSTALLWVAGARGQRPRVYLDLGVR